MIVDEQYKRVKARRAKLMIVDRKLNTILVEMMKEST